MMMIILSRLCSYINEAFPRLAPVVNISLPEPHQMRLVSAGPGRFFQFGGFFGAAKGEKEEE
jgi:hypothetical protein